MGKTRDGLGSSVDKSDSDIVCVCLTLIWLDSVAEYLAKLQVQVVLYFEQGGYMGLVARPAQNWPQHLLLQ